jgi:tetratricopeptide (TPR) repeat protein
MLSRRRGSSKTCLTLSTVLWFKAAQLHTEQKYEQALVQLQNSYQLLPADDYPHRAKCLRLIARLHLALGNSEEAESTAKQSLVLEKSAMAYFLLFRTVNP